jgi:hypothetical protein
MFIKIIIFSLISFYAIAFDSSQLQSGDVLLISFNCYECRVIESETNSTFSHSGVVIKNEKGEILIGQSLGMVALYSLPNFLKNKTPGTKASVFRSSEISKKLNLKFQNEMFGVFNSKYKGLFFDSKYLWNNYDDKGNELLYCSEFVAKYLDNFLSSETIPYPLTYTKNYSYWIKYFNGNIPDGELGNSPASISRDERFKFIGLLD